MALAVAAEWDMQVDHQKGIEPSTMPITTLCCTAIDQIQADPSHSRSTCISFLPTDTALFFAPEEERILLKKQRQHFNPILRWMKQQFKIEFSTSQNILGRIAQPVQTCEKISKIVNSLVGTCLFNQ
jgi:chaperone required for assembly of F1-ATPase